MVHAFVLPAEAVLILCLRTWLKWPRFPQWKRQIHKRCKCVINCRKGSWRMRPGPKMNPPHSQGAHSFHFLISWASPSHFLSPIPVFVRVSDRSSIPTDQLRSITGIHSLNRQVADTMSGFSFVLICAVLLEECKSEKCKTEQQGLSSMLPIKRGRQTKRGQEITNSTWCIKNNKNKKQVTA